MIYSSSGWVRTDMSSGGGNRDPDDAAPLAVWLATLPKDSQYTGKFFQEIDKETKWEDT